MSMPIPSRWRTFSRPSAAAGVLRERGFEPSFDGPHLTAKFDGTRPEDLSRALVERGVGLRGFVVERHRGDDRQGSNVP